MKFKVTGYNGYQYYHECLVENGEKKKVDIMVSGDLPEGTEPLSLVGKDFECSELYPHIELALNVKPL